MRESERERVREKEGEGSVEKHHDSLCTHYTQHSLWSPHIKQIVGDKQWNSPLSKTQRICMNAPEDIHLQGRLLHKHVLTLNFGHAHVKIKALAGLLACFLCTHCGACCSRRRCDGLPASQPRSLIVYARRRYLPRRADSSQQMFY